MGTIQDRDIHADANIARVPLTFHKDDVAISQADVKVASFKPGYDFEIVGVQHFAAGVAANASYMVKIGATNALDAAAVPVAATRGDATLHATRANRQGTEADEINLHVTTDGTGTLTDLSVIVLIRPRGLRGEPRT
jgi:hypothetical protein